MREYKPPRKRALGDNASLWVPLVCVECKRVKVNADGQSLYFDLLAAGWRAYDGEWRCNECQEARDALRALDDIGPVEDKY